MSLCIVGTGLVSPAALTPRANACVLWAHAFPEAGSPFLRADGEPVPVSYCPWLGARMSLGERMLAMATTALDDSLRPLKAPSPCTALFLCLPRDRSGLLTKDREHLQTQLAARVGVRETTTFVGADGVFHALHEAESRVEQRAGTVAIVSVDSFISTEALAEHVENPPSPWGPSPPPFSEGAAALVVTTQENARRLETKPLGEVHDACTATGAANDDNDLPADGEAMGSLLRRLRLRAPAPLVFGQFSMDAWRDAEWQLAIARNPTHVLPEYEMRSIELEVGRMGDAAGAMNLVYALAVARHRTTDMAMGPEDPLLTWCISRDGVRGMAAVSART